MVVAWTNVAKKIRNYLVFDKTEVQMCLSGQKRGHRGLRKKFEVIFGLIVSGLMAQKKFH